MKKRVFKHILVLALLYVFNLNLYAVTVSVMPFRVFDDDARTNYNAVDGLARLFSYELFNTRRIHVTDYDLFVAYARDVDNFYNYDILSTNRTLAINYSTNFFKTDYIVFGDVLDVSLITNEQDNIDKAYISIGVELIDVNTMEMITNMVLSTNYSMPTSRYNYIQKMDSAYFYEGILGKACISVSEIAANAMVHSLGYPSVFGSVTKVVKEENSIYINLGKNNTILSGDIFEIYDIKRTYQEYTTIPNEQITNISGNTNELSSEIKTIDEDTDNTDDTQTDLKELDDDKTDELEKIDNSIDSSVNETDNTTDEDALPKRQNQNQKRVARTVTGEIIGEEIIKRIRKNINNKDDISTEKEDVPSSEDTTDNEEKNTNDLDDSVRESLGNDEKDLNDDNEKSEEKDDIDESQIKEVDLTIIRSNNAKDSIKKRNYVNRFNTDEEKDIDENSIQTKFIIIKDKTGKVKYFEKLVISPNDTPKIIKSLLPGDFLSYYRPIYTNDNNEQFYLSEMLFKYKLVKEETNFVGYARVSDLYDTFAILEILELAYEDDNTKTNDSKKENLSENVEEELEEETEEVKLSYNGFKGKSGKVNYKLYEQFLKEENEKKQATIIEKQRENNTKLALEKEELLEPSTEEGGGYEGNADDEKVDDEIGSPPKKREVDNLMRVILIGDK